MPSKSTLIGVGCLCVIGIVARGAAHKVGGLNSVISSGPRPQKATQAHQAPPTTRQTPPTVAGSGTTPNVMITETTPAPKGTPQGVVVPDTSAPAPGPVHGLQLLYSGFTKEVLTWDAVPGAQGYEVYRSNTGSAKFSQAQPFQTTMEPDVTIRDFRHWMPYVYYVLPFSSGGKVNKDPVYGLHLVSAMPATHMRGYENDIVFINAGNGAWATGWIDSGKIITCDHVVQGRKGPFTIQFVYEKNGRYHLGRKHRVGVLVTDYKRDEAALVPVNPDLFSRLHGFPLPTTTPPRIGEKVFAVGFPGRKLTLMEGTFLGPGKPTILEGFGRNNHPYHIQMTVHPGASGSPVFNLDGQIFGMVEGYEQDDPGVSIDIQGKYFDRVAVKTYAVTGRGTQFISSPVMEQFKVC